MSEAGPLSCPSPFLSLTTCLTGASGRSSVANAFMSPHSTALLGSEVHYGQTTSPSGETVSHLRALPH